MIYYKRFINKSLEEAIDFNYHKVGYTTYKVPLVVQLLYT
jgi:hypothetical protein